MRVISGKLGGRTFTVPKTHRTHPMSEKARGGLFNILGDMSGQSVLDAFAGTGAISFEAISRGAASSVAVDIDKRAITTIVKGVADLDLEGSVKVVQANVSSWSSKNSDEKFDIVICDPPYNVLKPSVLIKVAAHTKIGGVVVYSLPPKFNLSLPINYQLLTTKSYGDAQLVFYRRKAVS